MLKFEELKVGMIVKTNLEDIKELGWNKEYHLIKMRLIEVSQRQVVGVSLSSTSKDECTFPGKKIIYNYPKVLPFNRAEDLTYERALKILGEQK